jgi:hypothetical protein
VIPDGATFDAHLSQNKMTGERIHRDGKTGERTRYPTFAEERCEAVVRDHLMPVQHHQ